MENEFKIKKSDIEISFKGNQDFVQKQLDDWKETIIQILKLDIKENKKQESKKEELKIIEVKKNIDINDFFNLKKPNNREEEVIVTGYFLEKYEKKQMFSFDDVKELLNVSDLDKYLEINVEKGFLQRVKNNENKYCYTLTYSGEVYVKEGLQC